MVRGRIIKHDAWESCFAMSGFYKIVEWVGGRECSDSWRSDV